MELGAANRVTCSANEVLYPVKWEDQGCAQSYMVKEICSGRYLKH